MSNYRFDGRVAVVTGAGRGLGRTHALLLASRGARVVVNDLGVSTTGEGADTSPADDVVNEIKAAGGEAVANHDSVDAGDKIIQTALDTFGQIDIVVNNAGILRDKSFAKMADEDWDMVHLVHLRGAYKVTKAAWPHFREAGYGRVIMTSSASGIFGNFGQANYAAAKLGLYGFAQTLALEGAKYNIIVNAVAPLAGSRMTETILEPEVVAALRPEFVSPLVAYLCHEDNKETGGLWEVGAGWYARLRWERTQGAMLPITGEITPEDIAANWDAINDFSRSEYPAKFQDSFTPVMQNLQKNKS